MPASKLARYAMFGLLYFAQGAITSYFTALNALYLLSYNLSMTQIGWMGTIVMIPFVLKIFLGMLSDKVNLLGLGHRKPYIFIGLFVQAGCLIIVPSINPGTDFSLFALVAFILMLGMALYDTCTDGLALDTVQESEQGTIQGIMVGGRALGVVIISATIGLLVEKTSWAFAFWALGLLTLLPLPLVFAAREPQRPRQVKFQWKAFSAFGNRSIISLGILGALYSLIINAATQIVNPFMQKEFNVSLTTAGLLTTVWGIGIVAGSLGGGNLTDRLGKNRTVWVAMGMSFVSIAALSLIYSPALGWILVAIFGIAFGFYETVYFALAMKATDRRIAASMYSILMAIANLGTGIGLALSGALADQFGYRITFLIIAALNVLAIPLLPAIFQPTINENASPIVISIDE